MKIHGFALLPLLLVTASAQAFEGEYSLRDSVVTQSARIARRPDGTFGVKLEVTTQRCVGEWAAVGRVVGDVLVVAENGGGGTCSVAIRRTAIGIDVKEFTCDMHGARCSFEGPYTRVGASPAARTMPAPPAGSRDDTAFLRAGSPPAPAPAPKPALAGRFYCAEEINLDPAHAKDPNYRVKPIEPNTTLSIGYDFYYHGGNFAYSWAGDTTTYRSVRVAVSGDTAVYTGPKGTRWTVAPVGGRTVTIRGTGIDGSIRGSACSWR